MQTTLLGSAMLLGASLTDASPVRINGTQPEFAIQWGPCPEGQPARLDCAQLQVPVNWSEPDGEKIYLGMNRLNATDTANRIGSVIINPGGPGEVATILCYGQALGLPVFGEAVAERFDLVCPDPRGVGASQPVVCDPDVWNANAANIFPSTQDEFEELVNANRVRGENCLNLTGALLNNLDSISTAKDFEAIRIGLNDGLLNFIGISYGSLFGTTYAQMYPENIRAMALDGIVDHTQNDVTSGFVEMTSYENVLDIFFQWCAANATACGFNNSNIPQAFDDLIAAANKHPIPAPQCSTTVNGTTNATCAANVTGNDILVNAQGYLLSKYPTLGGYIRGWNVLGEALNSSINGNDATAFSNALATSKTDSSYPGTAVACQDFKRINTTNMTLAFAELQETQRIGNAFNPHTGAASQSYTIYATCAGWPAPVNFPQGPMNQTALSMTPEILMVNADHDPSTSYVWAVSVRQQLPNAVLLTREGDGHTSFFLGGQATDAINSYLVNLTLPEIGSVVSS